MSEQREKTADLDVPVLVVEDDFETRRIICHALQPFGYRIIEAADGAEAITICEKQTPHLVITDVMMPRVTGTEFVKWLRANCTEHFIPVLMLTALTDVENKIEGLELGADEYVTKPFNYRELQARAQGLIRIKILTERLAARNLELSRLNRQLYEIQEALIRKERELVAAQLAGTAAHNLGQPITTILLNCHLLEKSLSDGVLSNCSSGGISGSVKQIREECERLKQLLSQLQSVDPDRETSYVGNVRILELDGDQK